MPRPWNSTGLYSSLQGSLGVQRDDSTITTCGFGIEEDGAVARDRFEHGCPVITWGIELLWTVGS